MQREKRRKLLNNIYNITSVVREYHIIQTDEVCRVGIAPCYPNDAARVVVIYMRVI
jgi:hypothetical protein